MKVNKNTLTWSRLIHIYVSMALLTLLLFFSVTGITLNHPEWFSDHQAEVKEQETLIPMALLANPPLSPIQLSRVVEEIEIKLAISLDNAVFESLSDELFIGIKKAGKDTSISIDLYSGELFYQKTNYGNWAWLNDLHKGRNTSVLWGWVIDVTSALCIIFALSGFILAMPQRRFNRTVSLSLTVTVGLFFSAIWLA
jgi:hypothetical protein